MYLIALKMLLGDRAKFFSLVIGLCFAAFIISQQAAILVGIINRTSGFITDTSQPSIWVMDPTVQYIDDVKPLKETELYRVRGVQGVLWASPLYKGLIQARMRNGVFQTCILIGIDDDTLIGGPPKILKGKLENLRVPDGVIVDNVGAKSKLSHHSVPLAVGDRMELNDRRAIVVGICEVSRTFQSQPVIYTTYRRATSYAPSQRDLLSFILVHHHPDENPEKLCERIHSVTGLAAYTADQLRFLTIKYYFVNTGIFVNFGVAIILGFIIGTAIAGQTLYNFTVDNLPIFGIFKAMGADNALLTKMVLLQALYVSAIGWGLGIGAAALFGYVTANTELSFSLPLKLYFATGFSILVISLFAAFISLRRVIHVDPAIVFKS